MIYTWHIQRVVKITQRGKFGSCCNVQPHWISSKEFNACDEDEHMHLENDSIMSVEWRFRWIFESCVMFESFRVACFVTDYAVLTVDGRNKGGILNFVTLIIFLYGRLRDLLEIIWIFENLMRYFYFLADAGDGVDVIMSCKNFYFFSSGCFYWKELVFQEWDLSFLRTCVLT